MSQRVAETVLAKIGTQMGQFPTAAHLASWAGMCPSNDESAGKRRSGRTTKGSRWLRGIERLHSLTIRSMAGRQRDVVGVAVHEADMLSVGHNLNDVGPDR